MKYFIPFLIFLACGCTPQKRLANLLKQHPELTSAQVKSDTILVYDTDTFYTDSFQYDTVFNFLTDTVFKFDSAKAHIEIRKKNNNDYLLKILFDSTIVVKADTIRVGYIDTILEVKNLPITTAIAWGYRGQGILIACGVLLLILLVAVIAKMYV
jgi:hypothetical protein